MTAELKVSKDIEYRRHAKVLGALVGLGVLALSAAVLLVRHDLRATDRARLALDERIRHAFGLPALSYSSPLQSVSQVLQAGMSPVQVDSLLGRIRPDLARTEWFVVEDSTGRLVSVLQGLVLGPSGEEVAYVDVHYEAGRVAQVTDDRYGIVIPITADSARSLLRSHVLPRGAA